MRLVNKIWYIHTVELYTEVRMNTLYINTGKSQKHEIQKQTRYHLIQILKKTKMIHYLWIPIYIVKI